MRNKIPQLKFSATTSCAISSCLDFSSYTLFLSALQEIPKSLSLLRKIHALVITHGFLSKSVLGCRLIGYYGRLSGPGDAWKLFIYLPKRTSRAYNYMLRAYIDDGDYQSALLLYTRLLSAKEANPDAVSFSLLLKVCTDSRLFRVGRLLHAHILISGLELDLHLVTNLICFNFKSGCLNDAKKLFYMLPQRDVIVWTAMIDGYFCSDHSNEAMNLFSDLKKSGMEPNIATWNVVVRGFAQNDLIYDVSDLFILMQKHGIRPDKVSLCTILPLFSRSAVLKPGLEAHGYAIRNGLELDLFVLSALVDVYASCGKLSSARCLFDLAHLKDTGLWNAIIMGYGAHGECREALKLFFRMTESGVKPNEITFTAIFSACSHAGLVSEGCQIFDLMIREYQSLSSVEHYTCMVDMFGRAGRLEEAFEFIRKMPMDPTYDIWGSLLSACRTHSNVRLAEIVLQNIKNNVGVEAGYHIMMSNIYAEIGQWVDMAKLRTEIRDLRLKKQTGFSWIEVNGSVHTFGRADMSHPQSDMIHALLRDLEVTTFPDLTWAHGARTNILVWSIPSASDLDVAIFHSLIGIYHSIT